MASATRGDPQDALESDVALAGANSGASTKRDEPAMPLPGWLRQAYFLFPIILYIPDAIFNYYVYSDGITSQTHDPIGQAFWSIVWGMVAIGVVGMAYLLSVLAPWHWMQRHYSQALFCALGVIIATAITTWNSMAFRAQHFQPFPTDQWIYAIWPQLKVWHFTLTMLLVSVAPPFWGLFWAIVQPTEKNRSLRHLQESHQERLLRLQQEAEVKQLKAQANAKIREAQLRGMAQTAAAAREQAAGLLNRNKSSDGPATSQPSGALPAIEAPEQPAIAAPKSEPLGIAAPGASTSDMSAQEPTPLFTSSRSREMAGSGRGGREMYNRAAPAADAPRADVGASAAAFAQPALMSDTTSASPGADVSGSWPQRPRPTVGAGIAAFFPSDSDVTGATGPRPAVRRAAEPSPLLQEMNTPAGFRQVKAVIDDLKARGITAPTQRQVIAAVQERYEIEADMARKMVVGYKAAQKAGRNQ